MIELVKRIPRSVQIAAVLSGALTLTLAGAVGNAMSAPAAASMSLAPSVVLDYARDAVAFQPVGFGLVDELIGGGPVGSGPGNDLIASGTPRVIPIDPGRDPIAPKPRPTPPPDPGEDPGGGEDPPTVLPQDPILKVSIAADRKTVARNQLIKFTVQVRNVGRSTASSVRVDSHVPEHTTYAGVENCDGDRVQVMPGDGPVACVDGDDVVPPDEYGPYEHIGKTFSKLVPGETALFSFYVRVAGDAPHGHRVLNHAHASAVNALAVDSAEVLVVVE